MIFIVAVALYLASCQRILDEDPKAIALETFYNTTDEIKSAVLAIYAPLRATVYQRNYHTIHESQVDYGYGRGSYASISNFQGLDATNVNRISDQWTGFYQAIRNANLVITNAPKSISATPEQVDILVAEAKFMRAFCYFALVRNWGAVPLRVEQTMTVLDIPRSPESEVYDLILSDLQFAETYLPEAQSEAGRPQISTAKTVLTEVYLQLQRWTDARTKALEVINSNKYSLVKVSTSDDFYKIFGPDVNGTSEEVFYIKYNSVSGSEYAIMAHHSASPYLNGRGFYGVYTDSVTNKVISNWDYKDLRKKFMLYNFNIGFGPTTMLYKKYIDLDVTSNAASSDYNAYRYADVLMFYAEADCMANNGPTTDGMEKLNMVHRRAYGKDPNIPSSVDFVISDYTKDSFIDLILKERGYENMYEGKRFLDLKRTGKLIEVMKDIHGIDVAQKHLLWPIPLSEYSYNKAIDPTTDQNPGY